MAVIIYKIICTFIQVGKITIKTPGTSFTFEAFNDFLIAAVFSIFKF